MRYYPVNLDVKGQKCLIAGGGAVGTRKARILLECGAVLTVVAPEATETLQSLAAENRIRLMLRSYESSDMDGVFLVFGATSDRTLNARIQADAAVRNVLCNIADDPDAGNFTLPALIRRGDLMITVSTSGKSPALSRKLRQELENSFGPEYADCLDIMGKIREKLLGDGHDPDGHRELFRAVLANGLLEMLRAGDKQGVQNLLVNTFGPEYTDPE